MSACEHRHLSAENPTIKFGEPVHARCEACGAAVPIAMTLLLQGQADPAQNGPWSVSEGGEWTRPGDDVGTVVCHGVLDGSGAWHGPSPGGSVREFVEALRELGETVAAFGEPQRIHALASYRRSGARTLDGWRRTILHPDDILATLLPGAAEVLSHTTIDACALLLAHGHGPRLDRQPVAP